MTYEPGDGLKCKHCGGPILIRNPTGTCDHLYWPDMLTPEAKEANGYELVLIPQWRKKLPDPLVTTSLDDTEF